MMYINIYSPPLINGSQPLNPVENHWFKQI